MPGINLLSNTYAHFYDGHRRSDIAIAADNHLPFLRRWRPAAGLALLLLLCRWRTAAARSFVRCHSRALDALPLRRQRNDARDGCARVAAASAEDERQDGVQGSLLRTRGTRMGIRRGFLFGRGRFFNAFFGFRREIQLYVTDRFRCFDIGIAV